MNMKLYQPLLGLIVGSVFVLSRIRSYVSNIETINDSKQIRSSGSTTIGTSTESNLPSSNVKPIVFKPWPRTQRLPCYPSETNWNESIVLNKPASKGFLYVKPYKTGSSTSSGINIRIAQNVAKRQKQSYNMCRARFDHGLIPPGYKLFHNRTKTESILWTILRDPTKRVVSAFFHFQVSRLGIEPTEENFIEFVTSKRRGEDYYLRTLYTRGVFHRQSTTTTSSYKNPNEVMKYILRDYNFIGITERMDESLVALMMLLHLKLGDILYLSSKTSGGYDDAGGGNGCTLIRKSFISPKMKQFFESKQWNELIQYDNALYKAVNESLDLTINKLGRKAFRINLNKFKQAKEISIQKCLKKTIFPCDSNGKYHNITDCLWNDSGCGSSCLDKVADELGLW